MNWPSSAGSAAAASFAAMLTKAVSLSVIVPVPVSEKFVLLVPNAVAVAMFAVKVSVASTKLSSVMATVTGLSAVSPAANVT